MSRPKAGAGATETPALKPYINPVRLSVKTRETPSHNDGPDVDIDNAEAGPSTSTLSHIGTRPLSEQERLLKARKANEQVRKKGEKWADKLMEETVDRATFKKALRYIPDSAYSEITHERHLNHLCSYPLCSNPPYAAYNPNRKFRISTTNRSITEVEGNKEDGFCSRACRVKSEWVGRKLVEGGSVLARGKGWEVELVEDLDLDWKDLSSSLVNKKVDTEGKAKAGDSTTPSSLSDGYPRLSGGKIPPGGGNMPLSQSIPASRYSISRGTASTNSPSTQQPPAPPLADQTAPTDLLANLRIHERPTPSSPIPAPSAVVDSLNPTMPSPRDKGKTKRAPTSIVGEQSKLAQTVLKASKAINPIPQVNPDSESEEEHEEVEWERQVGLSWGGHGDGEDEEGGDLWEVMRAAREMEGQ